MKVKIKDISVNSRKRTVDCAKVRELSESISNLGLLNPITVSKTNNNGRYELIAGAHRLEAHKLLGHKSIEVKVKDFSNFKKELAEIDENLIRHELSIMEQGEMLIDRDEILTSLNIRSKRGDNRYAKSARLTNDKIAREIGLSKRTLQERKQIVRNIPSSVRDKLRGTRYANNSHGLLQLARQPLYIQKIAAQKILRKKAHKAIKIDVNEPNIVKIAIQQAHRDYRLKEFSKKSKGIQLPDSVELLQGDFRKICRDKAKKNSVHLIITDPPYRRDALPLYKELGIIANRVLKPSGFLICYVGTMYLPEVLNFFLEAGLKYHWAGVIKFTKGRNVEWNRRVWSYIRHFLVFYKPPQSKKSKFFEDYLESERREKDLHMYQQTLSNIQYLISRFSNVGDVVLEPFCGGGTIPLACLSERRNCIGIDIDKKAIKITKARIAEYLMGS
jgi:ParB/RepB/Spo0J family partition protein